MLAFRQESCLFDGSATLFLLVLSIICTRSCMVRRDQDRSYDYVSLLRRCGAVAGMALAQNLALFLVFLNLFYFAFDRWLRKKGLRWRFLIVRDDYADEGKGS